MADKLWYLSQINLLTGLDSSTLKQVEQAAPMVSVPPGAVLLRPEEPPQALYFLKRGRVRLYRVRPDGREVTLAVLGDGNVFGSAGPIELGGSNVFAQTMGASLICAMQPEDVEELLRRHPEVAMRLISLLGERVRELEAMVENLTRSEVGCRILYLLVTLSRDFGVEEKDGFTRIDVPLTHEDVATMIGSTRETVTSTLSRFVREGLVRTGRREIHLKVQAARERLADALDTEVANA